jgi:hypothetical protein
LPEHFPQLGPISRLLQAISFSQISRFIRNDKEQNFIIRLFLSPKLLLTFILVGSSAVQAQFANDTTTAPSMDNANHTLAIASNHTRDLRTGRALPTCGNGNRGDGRCANGQCCSQVRGNWDVWLFLLVG